MSTRESYAAGTPCWIDLMAPDVEAAKEFYTSLFGWTAQDSHDDDGTWIYTNFLHDGKVAAGLGRQPEEMSAAGMPPAWSTYVATDDVDATTSKVERAGGMVMLPPMDVMDVGRMAVYADPAGAVVSAWQPGSHRGAEVCNEPGTWSWNELMTRDLEAASAFYSAVFGWAYEDMPMPYGTYRVISGGDEGGIGGLMAMPPNVPDEIPSYWTVYFSTDDADATIARVKELGGALVHGPDDMAGVGRMATVSDPQGGVFMVMQPTS